MNASPLPHVAVVLAAGGSRRLGQPKQLLKRDGETLVHRAVRLALETKPQRVLLVVGGHAQAMRDAVADLEVEVVMNAGWEEGLASSVRAASSIESIRAWLRARGLRMVAGRVIGVSCKGSGHCTRRIAPCLYAA